MMNPERLPGFKWLAWLRLHFLQIGVLTGCYLSAVMVIAVLAANRLPFLEPYADIRNWVARVLFGLAMLIPILTYVRRPRRRFLYALGGWLLVLAIATAFGLAPDRLPISVRAVIGVVVAVHLSYFVHAPVQMCAAATVGWFLFTLAYAVMGVFFERLHSRFFTPFHIFVLGILIYGVLAIAAWVVSLAVEAARQPLDAWRRRPR